MAIYRIGFSNAKNIHTVIERFDCCRACHLGSKECSNSWKIIKPRDEHSMARAGYIHDETLLSKTPHTCVPLSPPYQKER